jgi:EpsD family peptidyl-prolyl cis-trans isomerase
MLVAVLPAALTLAGCDQVKKLMHGKPAGQVVATVNGQEITSLELRQELGNFQSRDPKIVKLAQQRALQQIIMRDLLVQKAKEAKLDKSAEFKLQVLRGEQGLLAQLFERSAASGVPAPTRQEAETFVSSHPQMFAQRRILIVDQVLAPPGKIDPQKFAALKTLDEVKNLFNSQNLPYQENVVTIDTLSANPQVIQQIDKLAPGDVFVVPQNGGLVFNHVSETRSVPFRGDLTVNFAMNALRQQRARDAVRTKLETIRKDAEPKIVYAAGYKPPPPGAKPATPGAPAADASAAGAAATAAPAPATPAKP